MMKLARWMAVVVVVGLASLVGTISPAAWAAWESSPPGGASAEGMFSGKIASVDPKRNMLKVKTGLLTQADVVVQGSTKISDGSRDITLQDLKPGDEITVAYHDQDGRRVAHSLTIGGQAAATPAGEQPKAAPDGAIGE